MTHRLSSSFRTSLEAWLRVYGMRASLLTLSIDPPMNFLSLLMLGVMLETAHSQQLALAVHASEPVSVQSDAVVTGYPGGRYYPYPLPPKEPCPKESPQKQANS